MGPLQVALLWALFFLAEGDVIVTQPGSELVLPITQQLTLRPPHCDRYEWRYGGIRRYEIIAEINWRCEPTQPNSERFPNMKISENGSLIISPVTAENAGTYTVNLYKAGGLIHTAIYTLHVEDPVSPPVLVILCLPDGRAQVFCQVDESHYTTYLHVTGASEEGHSSPSNNIAVTVPTSGPWSVTCTAENRVSQRNITQSRAACPDSSSSFYAKLLPVRLFLVIILPVFLVCFEVYHHLQEKRSGDFSRGNRNRKRLPAFPRENTE